MFGKSFIHRDLPARSSLTYYRIAPNLPKDRTTVLPGAYYDDR